MKKSLLFLFLLVCSFVFAQKNPKWASKIDSLLTLLKTDKDDTNKVNHLHKICIEYQNVGDYTKALADEQQTLLLAQKINWKKGEAKAYNSMGVICFNQGNYSDALKNHFA